MEVKIATFGESEFLHLKIGGFFEQILEHPDVELYRTADGTTFVMRVPGVGAVQVLAQNDRTVSVDRAVAEERDRILKIVDEETRHYSAQARDTALIFANAVREKAGRS